MDDVAIPISVGLSDLCAWADTAIMTWLVNLQSQAYQHACRLGLDTVSQ